MQAPQNPAGEFVAEENYSPARHDEFIATIEKAPAAMRDAVKGLDNDQLDTKYRNWTIRQIVHHVADSHANSYIRFKWALTENNPTIKAYDEGLWSELQDARTGDIAAPLALLDGLHAKWVQLLRSMSEEQFSRPFVHPEGGPRILRGILPYYAWHCRHHTAQIIWVRRQRGW